MDAAANAAIAAHAAQASAGNCAQLPAVAGLVDAELLDEFFADADALERAVQSARAVAAPGGRVLASLALPPASVSRRLGAFADPDVTFPDAEVGDEVGGGPFKRMPLFLRACVRSVSADHVSPAGEGQRLLVAWYVCPSAEGESGGTAVSRVHDVVIVVRGEWLGTDVAPGDIIHIVVVNRGGAGVSGGMTSVTDVRFAALGAGVHGGALRASLAAPFLPPDLAPHVPLVVVDDERHALVLHPDMLVAPTKIPAPTSCLRKGVLSELLLEAGSTGSGGGGMVTTLGTIKHSLFEHALAMVSRGVLGEHVAAAAAAAGVNRQPPTPAEVLTSALEAAAAAIIADPSTMDKLYACGESAADPLSNKGGAAPATAGPRATAAAEKLGADREALAELLGTVPGLVDWFSAYMGVRGPSPPSCTPPVRVVGLYGTEMQLWSPVWGLKGFLDAAVMAEFASAAGEGAPRRHVELQYDVTLDDQTPGLRNIPLELKTGRRPRHGGIPDHEAQVLLYSLLLEERYGPSPTVGGSGGGSGKEDPASGLLVYLASAEEQKRAGTGGDGPGGPPVLHYSRSIALSWPAQRSLLVCRSMYTAALVRAKRSYVATPPDWPRRDADRPAGVRPDLPPIAASERECGWCYLFHTCSSMYAARELPWALALAAGSSSEARPQLLSEISGDIRPRFAAAASSLSPAAAAYVDHWMRLVDLEEDAGAREKASKNGNRHGEGKGGAEVQGDGGPVDVTSTHGRAATWLSSSSSREADGQAASRLVLVDQMSGREVEEARGGNELSFAWDEAMAAAADAAIAARGADASILDHAMVEDANKVGVAVGEEEEGASAPPEVAVEAVGEEVEDTGAEPSPKVAVAVATAFLYTFLTVEALASPEAAAAARALAVSLYPCESNRGVPVLASGLGKLPRGARSLLDLSIARGAWVSISGDVRGPYGAFSGSVLYVTPSCLIIRGDRDVRAAFPDGFLRQPRGGAEAEVPPPFLWRIDADESNAVTRVIKDNILRLVSGPSILWRGDEAIDGARDAFAVLMGAGSDGAGADGGERGDLRRQRLLISLEAPRFLPVPPYPWVEGGGSAGAAALSSHPRIDASGPAAAAQKTAYEGLNDEQRLAVDRILSAQDYVCLLGMPGTGKTSTLVAAIRALVGAGRSVLVTSHTHSAVDTLLSKLIRPPAAEGEAPALPLGSVVRMGKRESVGRDMQPFTLEAAYESGEVRSLSQLHSRLTSALVVGSTCLGIRHPVFSRRRFDVAIVDEASQIPEPIALGPLRCARVFVLVGDHHQLPPLVVSPAADAGGLGVSLFKRLCDTHPGGVTPLTRQYRMNAEIQSLPNALVYGGYLRCGSDAVATGRYALPRLSLLPRPFPTAIARADAQAAAELAGLSLIPASSCPLCPDWLTRALDPLTTVLFIDTDGAEGEGRAPVKGGLEGDSHACWGELEMRAGGADSEAPPVLLAHSPARSSPAGVSGAPKKLLGAKLARHSKNVTGAGGTLVNKVEAAVVSSIVQGVMLAGGVGRDVGVISPYRSQLRLLSRAMEDGCGRTAAGAGLEGLEGAEAGVAWSKGVEVDTVDRYQGRDKAVILLSLVRSNSRGEVGSLLMDGRRLNVALSRAKLKLIVVGSASTLGAGSSDLAKMLALMRHRGWTARLPQGAHLAGWFPPPIGAPLSVLGLPPTPTPVKALKA
jgi:hypothetical protein